MRRLSLAQPNKSLRERFEPYSEVFKSGDSFLFKGCRIWCLDEGVGLRSTGKMKAGPKRISWAFSIKRDVKTFADE